MTARRKVIAEFGRHRVMVRFGRYHFGVRRIGQKGSGLPGSNSYGFGLGVLCGNWMHRSPATAPRYSLRIEGRSRRVS